MDRIATRFRLVVTLAVSATTKVAAQERPSGGRPDLQSDTCGEDGIVKRTVDELTVAEKALEVLQTPAVVGLLIARALCFSISAAATPLRKVRRW
jgi:hypothetical protein